MVPGRVLVPRLSDNPAIGEGYDPKDDGRWKQCGPPPESAMQPQHEAQRSFVIQLRKPHALSLGGGQREEESGPREALVRAQCRMPASLILRVVHLIRYRKEGP
jgi:hypothetical protein